MTNPFGTAEMAAGYAAARPPLHARILAAWSETADRARRAGRALDLGCGAGLSTRALQPFARDCTGIEPAVAMLRRARAIAPDARFVAGAGEALPLADGTVDLVTAAGSLNYVTDLARCLAEIGRILARGGTLLVYDFATGRRCRGNEPLPGWFTAFTARYPYPMHEARPLDPRALADAAPGFELRRAETLVLEVPMQRAQYEAYVLTETNVAAAVRRGTPLDGIRTWVGDSLRAAWAGGERTVLFDAYWADLASRTAARATGGTGARTLGGRAPGHDRQRSPSDE